MIHARISEIIGSTPVLELPLRRSRWRLLLKLEKFNPGQSMKDRMALSMIADAERSGRLSAGGTIVESSSGNTGTGLAMLAAERGYRFVAVVDGHASPDKLRVMQAYGAELVHVSSARAEYEVATREREERAAALAASIPGAVFLEQAHNSANPAGYEALADELVAQLGTPIDHLIGAVGTGGSLCGTARALRRRCPELYTIGVEPVGSIIFGGEPAPYFQSGTGTPGGVDVGRNVDRAVIDRGSKVSDRDAFATARCLAHRGVLVGGSAGGVVYAALSELAERVDGGVALAILADGGEKYLDTIFDDAWMARRGLLDAVLEQSIADWLGTRVPVS